MCIHYEIISTPAPEQDIIGVCQRCGKVTNYTELQRKYGILFNPPGLRDRQTYDNILNARTGNTVRMKQRREQIENSRERLKERWINF